MVTTILFKGKLKGFDQTTNLILQDCEERIYCIDDGVEIAPLGLYIIRGDNVYDTNLV